MSGRPAGALLRPITHPRRVSVPPLLAVLAAVAIGAVVGAGQHILAVILLALAGAVAAVLTPMLTLVVLIPVSMMGQLQALPGAPVEPAQVVALLFIAGVWVRVLLGHRTVMWPPGSIAAGILLAGYFTALRLPSDPTAAQTVLSFGALVLLFVSIAQVVDSVALLRRASASFVASAATVSAFCLVALALGIETITILGHRLTLAGRWGSPYRLGGLYEQPNVFAQLVVIAYPIALALWLERGRHRSLWAAASTILALGLILAQSRTAMVGGVIGTLIVLWLMRRGGLMRWGSLALAGVAVFVAIRALDLDEVVSARVSLQTQVGEVSTLVPLHNQAFAIPASWRVFLEEPLGHGVAAAGAVVGEEAQTGELSPHNAFLGWAVELGILGLAGGLAFAFAQLRGLMPAARIRGDVWTVAVGLLAGLAASWIHNLGHATIHWVPVWVAFGLAGATSLIAHRRAEEP
jgi:hypothetical protein